MENSRVVIVSLICAINSITGLKSFAISQQVGGTFCLRTFAPATRPLAKPTSREGGNLRTLEFFEYVEPKLAKTLSVRPKTCSRKCTSAGMRKKLHILAVD